MSGDRDGLKRVLEAFDNGDWDEIHLESGDLSVHLSTVGPVAGGSQTSHVSTNGAAQRSRPPGTPAAPTPAAATPAAAGTDAPAPPSVSNGAPTATSGAATGLVEVVAPSPGIFWRSPSPGAPPFVEAGGLVENHAVLCIVEIMKLMNTVTAPVGGDVVEILVGNGEPVDRGQVMFRLRPEA